MKTIWVIEVLRYGARSYAPSTTRGLFSTKRAAQKEIDAVTQRLREVSIYFIARPAKYVRAK